MTTPEHIWKAIDLMAAQKGLAVSRLAINAGIHSSTVNMTHRRNAQGEYRWPNTETLFKVMAAAGLSLNDLPALLQEVEKKETDQNKDMSPDDGPREEEMDGADLSSSKQVEIHLAALTYPSYRGRSQFTKDGLLKNGTSSYLLRITNSTMSPIYSEDDVLIVSPGVSIRENHRAIIFPITGPVTIGRIISHKDDGVFIESFVNDELPKLIPRSEIAFAHRIEWLRQ